MDKLTNQDKEIMDLADKMKQTYMLLSRWRVAEDDAVAFLAFSGRARVAKKIVSAIQKYVDQEKQSQRPVSLSQLQILVGESTEKVITNEDVFVATSGRIRDIDGKIIRHYRVKFNDKMLSNFVQIHKDTYIAGSIVDLFKSNKSDDASVSYEEIQESLNNSHAIIDSSTKQFLSYTRENKPQPAYNVEKEQQRQTIRGAINPNEKYFRF